MGSVRIAAVMAATYLLLAALVELGGGVVELIGQSDGADRRDARARWPAVRLPWATGVVRRLAGAGLAASLVGASIAHPVGATAPAPVVMRVVGGGPTPPPVMHVVTPSNPRGTVRPDDPPRPAPGPPPSQPTSPPARPVSSQRPRPDPGAMPTVGCGRSGPATTCGGWPVARWPRAGAVPPTDAADRRLRRGRSSRPTATSSWCPATPTWCTRASGSCCPGPAARADPRRRAAAGASAQAHRHLVGQQPAGHREPGPTVARPRPGPSRSGSSSGSASAGTPSDGPQGELQALDPADVGSQRLAGRLGRAARRRPARGSARACGRSTTAGRRDASGRRTRRPGSRPGPSRAGCGGSRGRDGPSWRSRTSRGRPRPAARSASSYLSAWSSSSGWRSGRRPAACRPRP